jgi:hypothetical protein
MNTTKPLFAALALLFLFLLTDCTFYQRYPMAKSRLPKIEKSRLTFYLLDAAHPRSRVWYISEAEFQDDKITGFLVKLEEFEAEEVATVSNNRDAKMSRDEVLLFAKPRFAMTLRDTITTTITHDQLEKIEVYEVNHGKSVAISAFAIIVPLVFFSGVFAF